MRKSRWIMTGSRRESQGRQGIIAAHHDFSLLLYASLMHLLVARTGLERCMQSFHQESEM